MRSYQVFFNSTSIILEIFKGGKTVFPSSRPVACLRIEAGVDIVNIFLIHPFLGKAEAFAEALEMNDLTRPQELDHIVDIRIIRQTQNIVVGDTGFLFCCQIFCQIGDHIAFDRHRSGAPRKT